MFKKEKTMHKKIGIIGGLSPESTVSYYLYITRTYVERFGSCEYPEIIIYSVNFENYNKWLGENRWDQISEDMIGISKKLKQAGADFGLIATNTMHKVFDTVQNAVDLPLIHLIDATATVIKKKDVSTVGLLGTRFTMSDGFYKDRLAGNGLKAIVPETKDQETIHRIIMEELTRGKILEKSRKKYIKIINKLKTNGVEAVILGCTEIPLLIKQEDCNIPLMDTAMIHAEAALSLAVSG